MRCRSRKVKRPSWQQVTRYIDDRVDKIEARVKTLRSEVNRLKAAERPHAIGFQVTRTEENDE